MSDREFIPWQDLIKRWEIEAPLILQDQIIAQLLMSAEKTEKELSQQKELNQELSMNLADVRARVKVFLEDGGIADV